ncbi:AraC family transcriptional regulator [Agriterribacter sp.]|uniref:helix-turn-helix domain-containing protein n=1 Tax=Agriterribacter sp. TaxID=2821509 RepID=UPI002D0B3EB5|nr:AraC family transcriptional regulator [Agriterribacter sp.]HRO47134.1 AraC family transcriptional regulator [Agriterribacter sp.]HRQ17916.1 AraC family transcriptional regulator [Agriterribacter sp.]
MYNIYAEISTNPGHFRQLSSGEALLTIYNCPIENKYQDFWSHYNYIVYVVEGRKIWHTAHGSYDLYKGSCVFVRKGACIAEQFFDPRFCLILFFLPDAFICEVLKSKSTPINRPGKKFDPVMAINNSAAVEAFFRSMMPYFEDGRKPDQALLYLKFRELILLLADSPANHELLSYFCSLLQEPQSLSLQRVMEDNFCYNLKLEEFARLSSRSLSAFKRDFLRIYHISPGKWLLEKRLDHALHLLTHMGKTVSETAFESGFESLSHFSRVFRRRFGRSPASLKQQNTILN